MIEKSDSKGLSLAKAPILGQPPPRSLRWPMAFLLLALTASLSAQTTESESFPRFLEFRVSANIYEPSGVVQLPDERLVIVEDESSHALSILSLNAKGETQVVPLKREALLRRRGGLRSLGKLSDLEGMALDRNGYVYAVTSYSRTEKKGRISPSREKLVRFQIQGSRITNSALIPELKKHITAQYPTLVEAARHKTARKAGGLNIEGLAFKKTGDQLWFGFRSPLKDNKAIILALENPDGVFVHEAPRFTEILLDLNGAGIRGLAYDARLKGYLILARREDKKKMPFELWFWTGGEGDATQRIKVTGVDNLHRAEAITPIKWGEKAGIIIFSDEGNARKGKQGRYILLQYDQISIAQ